jgi:STE24 endopeptidase
VKALASGASAADAFAVKALASGASAADAFAVKALASGASAADAFAVKALASGASARALETALIKLNRENASNLWPAPLYSSWYYSHPTLTERLAAIRKEIP